MTLQKQLEYARQQLESYTDVAERVACNIAIYQQEVERLEKLIAAEATAHEAQSKPVDGYRVESADIPVAPLDSIGE